MLFSRTSAEKF